MSLLKIMVNSIYKLFAYRIFVIVKVEIIDIGVLQVSHFYISSGIDASNDFVYADVGF